MVFFIVGKINFFFVVYCGVIFKGLVLFFGVGDGIEIVYLVVRGYVVYVFE